MSVHHLVATLVLSGAILIAASGLVVAYRFIAYCLAELEQAPVVSGLTRDAWRLLIIFWIPVGGLLYLRFGRHEPD